MRESKWRLVRATYKNFRWPCREFQPVSLYTITSNCGNGPAIRLSCAMSRNVTGLFNDEYYAQFLIIKH